MTIKKADIGFGLRFGDEGKGKVISYLAKSKNYDYVCRWAGGPNAGHTVFLNGKRYKTHLIPSGIFHGIKSVIGPACVLNLEKFYKEIDYLESNGFDTSLIKVSPKTHIITKYHINLDKRNISKSLGTTSNGIAYAYADKAARIGLQAATALPENFLWNEELSGNILCEGAQGFGLDLDWGQYPYVTSSHTGTAAALLNGVDPRSLRDVWGVAKVYETYVGKKTFQPDSPVFDEVQRAGHEFGATTGRVRQCNWINCEQLRRSIQMNGVNKLVVNKMDVLREVGVWGIRSPYAILGSEKEMKDMIKKTCPNTVEEIFYSDSPKFI